MNGRRVLSVMRKEWWHITRDKTSFILLLLSPVLILITMGYAFSIDITDVNVAILDQDLTPASRELRAAIGSTDALKLERFPDNLQEVESLLMRGQVKGALIIPPGFEQALRAGRAVDLQIVIDGTDPNTAGHAIRHLGGLSEQYVLNQAIQGGRRLAASTPVPPIDLQIRAWYNPSLRYTVSMIPALVGIVLSVPAMAASLAFAREREWGTMEGLIATPIGRFELILGKLTPYMLAGMLSVPLILATAVIAFDIPIQGSVGLYVILAALFLFATMSIALFLSVFIKSQQAAIMASLMIFLFSGFFMSGLLIPFALMGPLIKMEAFMFPTTHFVIISRGIITKGIGLPELWGYAAAILGLGLLFFLLTILTFKKKL